MRFLILSDLHLQSYNAQINVSVTGFSSLGMGGILKVTCPTTNLLLESCQPHTVSFTPLLEPQMTAFPTPPKAHSFLGPTYSIFTYTEIPSE